MSKKQVSTMTRIDIENGNTLPAAPPVNRPAKTPHGKAFKPPAEMQTFALEPKPAKSSLGARIDRTPDAMFERVTLGLIRLDHTKRMQAISSALIKFAMRLFVATLIFAVVLVVVVLQIM